MVEPRETRKWKKDDGVGVKREAKSNVDT